MNDDSSIAIVASMWAGPPFFTLDNTLARAHTHTHIHTHTHKHTHKLNISYNKLQLFRKLRSRASSQRYSWISAKTSKEIHWKWSPKVRPVDSSSSPLSITNSTTAERCRSSPKRRCSRLSDFVMLFFHVSSDKLHIASRFYRWSKRE